MNAVENSNVDKSSITNRAALKKILGIAFLKTIFINIKLFPLKTALKLPVLIGRHTEISHIERGSIQLPDKIKTGIVKIGIGGTYGISGGRNLIKIFDGGVIEFRGNAGFARGCAILVKGHMIVGNGFSANKNCSFSCNDKIVFGDDCLLGWNIHVRDSDNHPLYYDDVRTDDSRPVIIGRHVWVCSEAHVLKGTEVPDNCVVGYKAVTTKAFTKKNALIVGFPADVKKENIRWEH